MKRVMPLVVALNLLFVVNSIVAFGFETADFNKVLKELKNNKEIYLVPNDQDLEGAGLLEGILSENFLPPYVLSPRRQTDSLVRQMYEILPQKVKEQTAFVITDRLVQNPEAYLDYLKNKKEIVLIGSFYGIGTVSSVEDPEWEIINKQHNLEFYKLEKSIKIAQSLNLSIKDVVFGMGDSASPLAEPTRQKLQARFNFVLKTNKISFKEIAWGADEIVPIAFAKQLASKKVWVKFSNPKAVQFMDGLKPADKLFKQKAKELGLTFVNKLSEADILVFVYTRKNTNCLDDFQPNDIAQRALDKFFSLEIEALTPEQRNKTVIIDARLFNGAWDEKSVPKYCDYLAFASWGTFANKVGATLALAKILKNYNSTTLKERLFLEAVYHDVFFNGYETVQRLHGHELLKPLGLTFSHFEGYSSPENTAIVFEALNNHANSKIQEHYQGTKCMKRRFVRATPQFWRTFESEVHLWPLKENEKLITGLYRKDLPPEIFNPEWGISSIISAN